MVAGGAASRDDLVVGLALSHRSSPWRASSNTVVQHCSPVLEHLRQRDDYRLSALGNGSTGVASG
jgi:hypothetical protein